MYMYIQIFIYLCLIYKTVSSLVINNLVIDVG